MNDFKVGDLVVCIDNSIHYMLEVGKLYKIRNVERWTVSLEGFHPHIPFFIDRFRKVKKAPDTKITRLLCKVYKEENGYIYI